MTTLNRVDTRRAQPYHNGIKTKVMSLRVPLDVYDRIRQRADDRFESMAEIIIRLVESQDMRKR